MPPKILVRPKTTTTPTPTPGKRDPVNNLLTVLSSAKLGENTLFTKDQVQLLLGLTLPSGEKILTASEPSLVIDVLNLFRHVSFEDGIDFLRSISTLKEASLDSPLMENEQERVRIEVDNLQRTIETVGGEYKCPGCGGDRTISMQKQLRSGDEGASTLVRCLSCGRGWRID